MQLFLGTGLAADPRGRGRPLPPPVTPPRAVRPPSLVGTGRIGEPLAVDPGAWTGALRFGFAWLKDGAPIAGAEGEAYAPVAADDRAALACRVTAAGAGGAVAAITPAITIAFPAPVAVGPIPDLLYTQFPGSHVVDISPFFTGSALRFSVTGSGVAVDPATGVVTLDVAALAAGGVVTVAAANSGGRVELDLALRLATPPVAVAPPTLAGSGRIGEALVADPGVWAGQPAPALALQWLAGGVAVAGAVEASFTPGAGEDGKAISCRVTATNAAGVVAVETAAVTARAAAPAVVGALADLALALGAGAHVLDAAAAFAGTGLVFAVEGAGASIDAATGRLSIPTGTALAAAPVTVTATNSGGAAQAGFRVTVLAAPVALAAPAPVAFATAAGTRAVEAAAFFAGDALVFALDAAPAGVAIDAATGTVRVPTAAALAGEVAVRATNAVGAATQRIAVSVLAAPVALAAPAPVAFATAAGTRVVEAAAFFAGDALVFALDAAPAGVAIDAATGTVRVPTAAALSGEVAVRATNAVGAATQRVAVSVLAAPVALAAPAPVAFDIAPGTGRIEAAAFFAGDALGFALDAAPSGVAIDAGAGAVSVPTAAALSGEVVVRAANVVGAATQRVAVEVRSVVGRPTPVGTPGAAVFLQGTGVQTVSAQAFFAGEGLVYALAAAPAGVTINPGSGLVSVPTEAAFAAAPVTVRASNAAGSATQTATVTVRATRTVFDGAAALGDVKFLFPSTAPAWSFNAGGFARLTSGADRAHGDWGLALGDGRYRALARWSAGVAAPEQSRPFGLIGRMVRTGANFQGVRVDAVLQAGGARVVQLRDYTGKTTVSTTLRQAQVAWTWDAWWWLEAEFEGATVRARLYPEGAEAPAWQVTATTTALAPGAFGPTTHVTVDGQIPVADIRRLEYLPLAGAAPAAAAAGDWTLDQITVKP